MGLKFNPIDKIPERGWLEGLPYSRVLDALRALEESPTKMIEVKGESPQELTRFYKSMVQWRVRHPVPPISVRKEGNTVYMWKPQDEDANVNSVDGPAS